MNIIDREPQVCKICLNPSNCFPSDDRRIGFSEVPTVVLDVSSFSGCDDRHQKVKATCVREIG
jgi:hypothetical protein